jgi:HK97 family phage portal protein
MGVSPLQAAGAAAGIYTELTASQTAFFHNMSRPSGILSTDMKLTAQQMAELRAAFEDKSKGINSGSIPILGGGIKWQPLGVTSQDAEVINALKLSNDEIFRALGIPPPLMGALEHATLSNVEQLVSAWLSFSLGGLIEKYERGLDRLFGFDSRANRVEMDVSILLRSDILARTEAHSKMINAGIATPNEIRRKEGMGSIEGGDNLFLQRQMTPVNLITELNAAELERAKNPPQPAPVAEPAPVDEETAKALALHAIRKAMTS